LDGWPDRGGDSCAFVRLGSFPGAGYYGLHGFGDTVGTRVAEYFFHLACGALWQQLERVSVAWPDDGEVAAVERGDPDRAVPLGQSDHGCVSPAQPQVSVGADQILDALPVGDGEICHF
jgi:hypothetical protein